MNLRKWTWIIIAATVVLCTTATAQTITANRLCIHNGADYYVTGYDHSSPNCGMGRYFPSFTHAASTEYCDPGSGVCYYPWKILGWMVTGLQAAAYGPDWHWSSCMVKSVDNPYSSMMTFMYPYLYTQGLLHSGPPPVVYNLEVPSSITTPSGFSPIGYLFPAPCSMGGFDQYMNIIAAVESHWTIPSTTPYYSWLFAWTYDIASPLMLTSNHSIYSYTWENTDKGGLYTNNGQYLLIDGDSMDCTGTLGGNKGRSYTLIGAGGGGIFSWPNLCTGVQIEMAMCVLVKDSVTIPVNVNQNGSGPYGAYGFDVGGGTITPFATSGQWTVQGLFESVEYDQHVYGLLASMKATPSVTYGAINHRVPGVDFVTGVFIQLMPYLQAQVNVGLPAAMFGTTIGGYTIPIPAGPQPAVYGLELQFFGWDLSGGPPTAAFMATFF